MTPRQPSVDAHKDVVLRTTADVLENAAHQASALKDVCPEYGADVDRLVRFQERVSTAARQVGHKSKRRR